LIKDRRQKENPSSDTAEKCIAKKELDDRSMCGEREYRAMLGTMKAERESRVVSSGRGKGGGSLNSQ
jgi:hypothetical protein